MSSPFYGFLPTDTSTVAGSPNSAMNISLAQGDISSASMSSPFFGFSPTDTPTYAGSSTSSLNISVAHGDTSSKYFISLAVIGLLTNTHR